ncbi:hypothetical protein K502DRAFT_367026 [Neoconidiobolus thromboides FSU 785]|nr:hypothetical protein K502DRAFT_367026 [Neoconidiobolus thromboides FSU 785]
MSRKAIDISTKLEIIKQADQGFPHKTIAEQFKIGRSTVTKIILNKDKIKLLKEGVFNKLRKRIRLTGYDHLENRLLQLCSEGAILTTDSFLRLNEDITGDVIANKAKTLLEELSINNLTIDNSWLIRFRRKYKLKFKMSEKRYRKNRYIILNKDDFVSKYHDSK